MRVLIFILLFAACLGLSAGETRQYEFSFSGKSVYIPVSKHESFWVNDLCLKDRDKCLALKSINKKAARPRPNKKLSSIAQAHCQNIGGHPIVMRDGKNSYVPFCMFKDKTMIDSWSAYHHRYGGKK